MYTANRDQQLLILLLLVHFSSVIITHIAMSVLSSDCQHFNLEVPDFIAMEELKSDMSHYEGMWSLYEEFNTGLQELAKEDWISFRWAKSIKVIKLRDSIHFLTSREYLFIWTQWRRCIVVLRQLYVGIQNFL